ncbi:MAG: DUF378 domain-containing protein [Alphaproteobacteria bacterium]|nr:DUF378 domain-containing protein [Alphaproteobacteria bacterium]
MLDKIFMILLIVGGINWGLFGLLGIDLVAKIFGGGTVVAKVVYILVGVAGVKALLGLLGIM